MEECLNTKSIVLREAFTDLLEGNMGRLQELIYLKYEKGILCSYYFNLISCFWLQ